jgi:hypothetical protein
MQRRTQDDRGLRSTRLPGLSALERLVAREVGARTRGRQLSCPRSRCTNAFRKARASPTLRFSNRKKTLRGSSISRHRWRSSRPAARWACRKESKQFPRVEVRVGRFHRRVLVRILEREGRASFRAGTRRAALTDFLPMVEVAYDDPLAYHLRRPRTTSSGGRPSHPI